jgi:hypothetical protein
MTSVTVTDTIDAPVDKVWKLVSDFGGIDKFMRGIDECRLEGSGLGSDRHISTGGGTIVERLTWFDPDAHALSYTILSGPLPVQRYLSTLRLSSEGQRTGIEWTGHFEPAAGTSEDEARKLVESIYTGGIKGYKAAVAG